MKIKLFLFLLAIGPLFCNAQDLKFGVHIDPVVTWFSAESRDVRADGGRFGINGGLIMDKYFQKNYAISTGISIGSQGGKLNYLDSAYVNVYSDSELLLPDTQVEYKMQYITVPLGLKLRTNQMGYFTYFARIGFTNQFNIKAKATSSDGTLNDDVVTKEVYWYNLSYHFGGGIEYGLSEDTALLFSVVFHNGITNVTENSGRVLTRNLSFRVGVMF